VDIAVVWREYVYIILSGKAVGTRRIKGTQS
jgi:hypothetical protein